VWRWAAIFGLPLVAFVLIWCAIPRPFYTGTDSVSQTTLTGPIGHGTRACVSGLQIPAGTRYLQVGLASGGRTAPRVRTIVQTPAGTAHSVVVGLPIPGAVPRLAVPVPRVPAGMPSEPARLCLRADHGSFALGASDAASGFSGVIHAPGISPFDRVAVWYRPPVGARRSLLDELPAMASRAARLAPGYVEPWLFWVVFIGVLPLVGLLAVRLLALAVAGGTPVRRLALWLFVIGALNGASWAVITPAFQSPDEVDHYAYTEALITRGAKPSPYVQATNRWSTAEGDALLATDFQTDHQISDTRAPGLPADVARYRDLLAHSPPARGDGGGYQTTSSYGPLYYYAVAPGYLLGGSPLSRLGGMRLCSALIGALAGVFALLAMLELVPRRPELAVLAGLAVALEPLYSFLSGAVNNDIGIDAGAAAVAYLLVRLVRRGLPPWSTVALGALLGILPWVKSSAYELWVMTLIGLLAAGWAHRSRLRAGLATGRRSLAAARPALVGGAAAVVVFLLGYLLCRHLNTALTPAPPVKGAVDAAATSTTGAASGPVRAALDQPGMFIVYLWQALLPPIAGMTRHFPPVGSVGELIFIRRGWGGFGWYDTFFPWWVYRVIEIAMGLALVLGLVALWQRRATIGEWWPRVAVVALLPIVVFIGFESAFWTLTNRPLVAEMGRYEFPALVGLAALGSGALLALHDRVRLPATVGVLSALLALGYAAHALTFAAFFS
jgi:hypothetical protein